MWTDDADEAMRYLLENGATVLSEVHYFLDNKLRSGWVRDPDVGNSPIQTFAE
jgi:glyoxylase I family protein